MDEIKVIFKTLTPLWTGDAWGENSKIRPSSLMGSLRFWFYIYLKSIGINCEELNKDGVPSDNLNDYIKKYNDKGTKETLESLLKQELLHSDYYWKAIKKVLDKLKLPLISQLFGCTGWKSAIQIKNIEYSTSTLEKNSINYGFLYDKLENTRTNSSKFWTDKLLFNEKDSINLFEDVSFDLQIIPIYLDEFLKFLKFLKFYGNKIIVVGGKKSFGFGFVKIESNQNLDTIQLSPLKKSLFDSREIKIDLSEDNQNILGFNFKHFQRLKESKYSREKNFGKQSMASNFYFSMHLAGKTNEVFLIGFSKYNYDNTLKNLMDKYLKFGE